MKFAKKRVNGWANRHIDSLKVRDALTRRLKNGFTLTAEERKFYDDIKSLERIYNKK